MQTVSPSAPVRPIQLFVDATDTTHNTFDVRMLLPVGSGALTLHYPRWLPGHHSPYGPVNMLAGLNISANGQPLQWTRDPLDVFRFQIEVPQGVETLELRYQSLTPLQPRHGRVTITPAIINLQWNLVTLYPAGVPCEQLPIDVAIKLPDHWQAATALTPTARANGWQHYATTDVDTLIDSPVFAGLHFKRVLLNNDNGIPVHLNIVADDAKFLQADEAHINAHQRMVEQAYALFRSQHYPRYEFLLSLSQQLGGIGLEHHASSENGVDCDYFTDWDNTAWHRDLLPHEFVHSWNGKFRRPAGQCVPDFNTPLDDRLLWVYEGQTQYWGQVLAARSGLWSAEYARGSLAAVAATFEYKRAGRHWRALEDTTLQPIVTDRKPLTYVSYQRTEDYYQEGQLLWLDADTRIRELTDGQKSLDDFAAAFFGVENGRMQCLGYTLEDVVDTLESVAPFDWATWLHTRVQTRQPHAPLDGLARAGWSLQFQEKPSGFTASLEKALKYADFSFSLGFRVSQDNSIEDVVWDGIAHQAGIATGMKLLAINGRAYKKERLDDALVDAAKTRQPLELLLQQGEYFHALPVPCFTGPRHPHLVRVDGTPDRLTPILSTKAG